MPVEIRQLKEKGKIFYPVTVGDGVIFENGTNLGDQLDSKQDTLVSGTNIKTVKGQSLLGSGNIAVIDGANIIAYNGTITLNPNETANYRNTHSGESNVENEIVVELSGNSQYYSSDSVLTSQDTIISFSEVDQGNFLVSTDFSLSDTALKFLKIQSINTNLQTSTTTIQCILIASIDLKGATGANGPTGITSVNAYIDNTSGTPAVSASISNQVLTLMFSGLKGAQGASGYSGGANELQVINDLTTGGTTDALSAEMGKTLKGMIPQWTTMTEEAYDLLVSNENTDDDVFYFLYEDE